VPLYFTAETLGPKRALHPNGALICLDVPIARTGLQLYRQEDGLPVQIGPEGYVKVEREPEEVFEPQAIASFEGVPVVNEHPQDGVTGNTWRLLAVGHVQNVRRGEGVQDHLLLADLFVNDPHMILMINQGGKRQVSAGYDADYQEMEPGHARQTNIRANHVAIVSSARCGPQCAIQDADDPLVPIITARRRKPVHVHLYV